MNQRSRFVLPDVSLNQEKLTHTGLFQSFNAIVDEVIHDANAGINIITEYPGFYRAIVDNKRLYNLFLKKMATN